MSEASKAKLEGMKARIEDKRASENPHPRGHREHFDWEAGWNSGEREMQRRAYERHTQAQAVARYHAVLEAARRDPFVRTHGNKGQVAYKCEAHPENRRRTMSPDFIAEHDRLWPECWTCNQPMVCVSKDYK